MMNLKKHNKSLRALVGKANKQIHHQRPRRPICGPLWFGVHLSFVLPSSEPRSDSIVSWAGTRLRWRVTTINSPLLLVVVVGIELEPGPISSTGGNRLYFFKEPDSESSSRGPYFICGTGTKFRTLGKIVTTIRANRRLIGS